MNGVEGAKRAREKEKRKLRLVCSILLCGIIYSLPTKHASILTMIVLADGE